MGRDGRGELLVEKRIETLVLHLRYQRAGCAEGSLRKESAGVGRRGRTGSERRRGRGLGNDLGAGRDSVESFDLASRIQRGVKVQVGLAGL